MILLAQAAAYADCTHDLAFELERNATSKDHDAAMIGRMDTEELIAALRVFAERLRLNVERPGSKCLVDGDIDAANPGTLHTFKGNQVCTCIHDSNVHRDTDFFCLILPCANDLSRS